MEAGDIQPTDTIIEIGPGIGVLTKELVAHAASVTAIELDGRMLPLLEKYTSNEKTNNLQQTCM